MKLAILVVILASMNSFVASDYQGNALLAMKVQLNASSNQLVGWIPHPEELYYNPCGWDSITCDYYGSIVIKVELDSFGFTGTLSPMIGDLQYLQVLSLHDNHITGTIPPEFGNLSSLTSLNLENNHLTGEIPHTLGNLSNLQMLDLSHNELSGNIPNSLSDISNLLINVEFNNLTGIVPSGLCQHAIYNLNGNNLTCSGNFSQSSHGGSNKSKTGEISGSIIGGVGLLSLLILFITWRTRKRWNLREIFYDAPGEDYRKIEFGQLKRFAYRELQIATEDFNERNIIGQGGFGKVYKGVLQDDNKTKIAVKRLTDFGSEGGEASFLREAEMIRIAVHKNLLKLIGFCVAGKEKLLVYPFMENLSVAYRLREFKPPEEPLDWPTRQKIAVGSAQGISYLHNHCNPKIIHRDVKAANVLLDTNLEAVVGDFGLAKLVEVRKISVTTKVRGTIGHIAPEYLSTGKSSEKTDVFGYGIMLLEIVTGQRAINYFRLEEEDGGLLLNHVWVKELFKEGRFDSIIDPNLKNNYEIHEAEKIIKIALLCTQPEPEERPAMSEAVRMLEGEELGHRWQEWLLAEVSRRQRYDIMQRRLELGEGSVSNLQDIELSGGR